MTLTENIKLGGSVFTDIFLIGLGAFLIVPSYINLCIYGLAFASGDNFTPWANLMIESFGKVIFGGIFLWLGLRPQKREIPPIVLGKAIEVEIDSR